MLFKHILELKDASNFIKIKYEKTRFNCASAELDW